MDSPPENDCCSVCHENFTFPCQANCSHWFCGDCILRVWQHSSTLHPCKCPICRRLITLLIPSEAVVHRRQEPEVGQVLENVEQYNRLFGGESLGLVQRLRDMPFLIKRLLRELLDPQRSLPLIVRARIIIQIVLSAIYVICPIDILPEGALGIIGLLDDIIIVMIVFLNISAVYRSALLLRHGGIEDGIQVETNVV